MPCHAFGIDPTARLHSIVSWCVSGVLLLLLLLQAMVNQVSHDHALLADRIARLTGPGRAQHGWLQPWTM